MSTYKKVVLRIIGGILILITLMYGMGAVYFNKHFFAGTTVNGIDVSFQDSDKVLDIMNKEVQAYALAVNTRDGGREKITASESGIQYTSAKSIEKQIKDQKCYLWFLPYSRDITVEAGFSVDKDTLMNTIKKLKCFENMEAPINARIVLDGDTYVILEEQNGSQIDLDQAFSTIETAIRTFQPEVSLTGCYLSPSVKKEDLKEKCDNLNIIKETIITYDFGDRTETVDFGVIQEWLTEDALDSEKVETYVNRLATKYDTKGSSRKFVTYDDRTVTVSGGDYGWVMDQAKETQALLNLIRSGSIEVRKPAYLSKAKSRNTNDIGFTYLELDLANDTYVFYLDGKPLVSGTGHAGSNIPTGCYKAEKGDEGLTFGDSSAICSFQSDAAPISDKSFGIPQEDVDKIIGSIKKWIPVIIYNATK